MKEETKDKWELLSKESIKNKAYYFENRLIIILKGKLSHPGHIVEINKHDGFQVNHCILPGSWSQITTEFRHREIFVETSTPKSIMLHYKEGKEQVQVEKLDEDSAVNVMEELKVIDWKAK